MSEEFSFKGPSRESAPVRLISLADWATGVNSDPFDGFSTIPRANILQHLKRDMKSLQAYDGILHAGDYGYDLTSLDGLMGDNYMKSVEPLVSKFPYFTIPGNHESNGNFTHYKELFKTPGTENWYSFDLGHAHFIMMDSEAFVGRFHTDLMLENHVKWIKEDLEKNTKPFTIVLGHRPIYCNPNIKCKVCTNSCTYYCHTLIEHLEELFIQHNV